MKNKSANSRVGEFRDIAKSLVPTEIGSPELRESFAKNLFIIIVILSSFFGDRVQATIKKRQKKALEYLKDLEQFILKSEKMLDEFPLFDGESEERCLKDIREFHIRAEDIFGTLASGGALGAKVSSPLQLHAFSWKVKESIKKRGNKKATHSYKAETHLNRFVIARVGQLDAILNKACGSSSTVNCLYILYPLLVAALNSKIIPIHVRQEYLGSKPDTLRINVQKQIRRNPEFAKIISKDADRVARQLGWFD